MKGICLAGGLGTRLGKLVSITNKHLLPIYDRPMIYYPIQSLVSSGITEILLICGGNSAGDFLRLLGNGEDFGLKRLNYAYQKYPKGIADALKLAEDFVNKEPMCVILGDNIFQYDIKSEVSSYENGAMLFGAYVKNPENYGVITNSGIIEKPKNPESNFIATGLYIYDNLIWDFINELTPSARGELEITDVNNYYFKMNKLKIKEIKGGWLDCGESIDHYLESQNTVKKWRLS